MRQDDASLLGLGEGLHKGQKLAVLRKDDDTITQLRQTD